MPSALCRHCLILRPADGAASGRFLLNLAVPHNGAAFLLRRGHAEPAISALRERWTGCGSPSHTPYDMRSVRCGGEAACFDRAMVGCSLPCGMLIGQIAGSGKSAQARCRADLGRSGSRGRDLARGRSARPRTTPAAADFLGQGWCCITLGGLPAFCDACHRSNCAVPITGTPTACGPARVRSVMLGIDGLSGIDGTRGLRGIRSVSVKGRPAGSGRRERPRKTQSGRETGARCADAH